MLDIDDVTISNKHVNIRCVQFDEDSTWGVPPIIYVQDLSTNGTYIEKSFVDEDGSQRLCRRHLVRAMSAVPFLDGEKIYLNPTTGVFVELKMETNNEYPPIASIMEQEIQVVQTSRVSD